MRDLSVPAGAMPCTRNREQVRPSWSGAAGRESAAPVWLRCERGRGAEVREDEDSDGEDGEDDCETMVEPLRQAGAQAVVRTTVRRRRAREPLEAYELVLTNRDLWLPTSISHQYRRREVQELQILQPWSAMLPNELRERSGPPPPEDVRMCAPNAAAQQPRLTSATGGAPPETAPACHAGSSCMWGTTSRNQRTWSA